MKISHILRCVVKKCRDTEIPALEDDEEGKVADIQEKVMYYMYEQLLYLLFNRSSQVLDGNEACQVYLWTAKFVEGANLEFTQAKYCII